MITLLSDFDGVWTDQSTEVRAVREHFVRRAAELLNEDESTARQGFEELLELGRSEPERNGWAPGGVLTAFTDEDPLLDTATVAALLDRDEGGNTGRRWRSAIEAGGHGDANAFAGACFGPAMRAARQEHGHGLVPGAADALDALRSANVEIVVVSNSPTAKLVDLFADIGAHDGEGLRLIGDARKWQIDDPAPFTRIGNRRVHIGRARYAELLREIRPDVVIGDLASVDLAVPAHLRRLGDLSPELRLVLHRHSHSPQWALSQPSAPRSERLVDEVVDSILELVPDR